MATLRSKYNGLSCTCLRNLLLGGGLLLPLLSHAQDVPADLPPKPNIIDLQRGFVADKFLDLASGIDSFFGTERNFQETNKSVLQVDATQMMGRNGSQVIALTYKAKFKLPNAQKRFHLMLESNPDQNLPGKPSGTLLQKQQLQQVSIFKEVSTPDSYGAALRFENSEDSHWRYTADGGLKADGGSDLLDITIHPFARSSASYTTPLDFAQLKITQSFFSFNTTGPGENTQFELSHTITDKTLVRATSGATFLYDKQRVDLLQDFSIFHTLDQDASLLYQLIVTAINRPSAEVSEYVALLLYRQRMHQDWVFLELNPQLHYPKSTNFLLDAQFFVRLEFMFSQ